MRRDKAAALVALAVITFVMPALERAITGQVEMLSTYGLVDTGLSLIALFWWFHLDKAEHDYRAGRLMNAGVLVLAAFALPIYFVRSRGWKRGAIAIACAAAFLGLIFVLEDAGEWIGARF